MSTELITCTPSTRGLLTTTELHEYFSRIGLPEAGRRLVEKARREAPVRKVQSRLCNVVTHYPSRKMARSIDTESRTVEFPAVIQYEHDTSVLEYYAQPVTLDVYVTDDATLKTSRLQHVPDFLLLRKDCIRIEEWRENARLDKLASKYPGRFVRDGGHWHYPRMEAHLHELGIQYRLRTPSEHPRTFVENIRFLADYFVPETLPVSASALAAIEACFVEQVAISIRDLIALGKRSALRSEASRDVSADCRLP
jgi:putative transposase